MSMDLKFVLLSYLQAYRQVDGLEISHFPLQAILNDLSDLEEESYDESVIKELRNIVQLNLELINIFFFNHFYSKIKFSLLTHCHMLI